MKNNTFLRLITDNEIDILYNLIDEDDKESNYRVKVILLNDEDYTVSEIKMMAPILSTKWICYENLEKRQ
jgi:hypothetical protein